MLAATPVRSCGRIAALTALLAFLGIPAVDAQTAVANGSPVADAAQANDLERVRTLLRDGTDGNTAQSDGLTAMHWAALNDNPDIIGLLSYAGAGVEPLTRLGGYTPLHLAARAGNAAAAEALLKAGAEVDAWTTTGVTALHFAAQANSDATVRILVERGASIDAQDHFQGRTPLVFAAGRNATASVAELLALGADPTVATDTRDYVGRRAADQEEQRLRARVRAAEAGVEPQAPPQSTVAVANPTREPPQDSAAPGTEPPADTESSADSTAAAEPELRALSSEEQIGVQGGFTPLHYAAREGHLETARLLLEGGADLNRRSAGDQSTPLLVAVINGNYDLARFLLDAGADPNLLSDDGVGPLFATLNIEWSLRTWYPQPQMYRNQETSYLDLMQLLLDAGADPNERTTTHVWYAAYNAGRMGVDFTGATPFWRAAYATDVRAMRLLVANGADPHLATTKLPSRRRFGGSTGGGEDERTDPSGLPPVPVGGPGIHPIHAASGVGFGTSRVAQQHRSVPDGWLPAMRYFVEELGVDPNLRDMDGFTAVHHSAARGDNETILYLVSQGADVSLVARSGQTTADMANSPEQRAQPHPSTVVLLEKLGSQNNHNCRSCGSGG